MFLQRFRTSEKMIEDRIVRATDRPGGAGSTRLPPAELVLSLMGLL
jgi:hypothetical protein